MNYFYPSHRGTLSGHSVAGLSNRLFLHKRVPATSTVIMFSFGRQPDLRCVLFAWVTPTHNRPQLLDNFCIFLFSNSRLKSQQQTLACCQLNLVYRVSDSFKLTGDTGISALIGPFKSCVVAGELLSSMIKVCFFLSNQDIMS